MTNESYESRGRRATLGGACRLGLCADRGAFIAFCGALLIGVALAVCVVAVCLGSPAAQGRAAPLASPAAASHGSGASSGAGSSSSR